MGAKIIDGKFISSGIKDKLKVRIKKIFLEKNIVPCIANIITVNDEAIFSYVSNKDRVCKEVGINTKNYVLTDNVTTEAILDLIDRLNSDMEISGIIVQLPLKDGLNEDIIAKAIAPMKDLDGLNPVNKGLLLGGERCFVPCTAKGILRLIKNTGIFIAGRNAVIVGRSNIVGKPTAALLLNENATVTVCHSKTKNLYEHSLKADILVSAVGKPGLITGDMVKEGAIIIDAGTKMINNKLTGDVDFAEVSRIASWITPVPGGVGSMTTAMLIENTLEAVECLLKY